MRQPPQIALLPDGRRLHLQDGPIDLIVEGFGAADEIRAAYSAAERRFAGLLDELCAELPLLRAQTRSPDEAKRNPGFPIPPPSPHSASFHAGYEDCPSPHGPVARRMHEAVLPLAADTFITPMAAVAGAVAEEVLGAMTAVARLDRAYVSNGGDVALHLAPGQSFAVGLVDRPDRPSLFGSATIHAVDPVRGIATSGWRGRSFSLGIADAVTVLAATAAEADAAATIVANAVDLPGHPAIERRPARDIQPDSDLGARLVTRAVDPLSESDIATALDSGATCAKRLVERGLSAAAALHLQGSTRVVALPLALHTNVGVGRAPTASAA
jgi:ApbE superfamily uncharacterized protein (UPF0280 family)